MDIHTTVNKLSNNNLINFSIIGLILIALILFGIKPISAEQIVWNNDESMDIFDSWRDVDGSPLTGATCSYTLYNQDLSINQSGTPSEFRAGIMNFTINQLPSINTYPLLINCTKNGFNGTSSKDSIRIINELTENLIDDINSINNNISLTRTDIAGVNETLDDLLFITKVNAPKFHLEAFQAPKVGNEVYRLRIIIRPNGIEGDPTVSIGVPVQKEEDVVLTNPDDEPLPFEFHIDQENNPYITFGSTVTLCNEEDGIYDREYACQGTTYYLKYLDEVSTDKPLITQVKAEEIKPVGLNTLFSNSPIETRYIIIASVIILGILIFISFIIIIMILEKVSRNKRKPVTSGF